ncbi:MAG: phosphate ABC transporter permease PstA [Candidatus Odinarchaeum yellowstonii]|uniref:Phosphate transport system permease protein PstA n=1 Tax=Odinarchaeota yellowstonii (strain LCB_4) TaxID=1841599 RepID=A0AAF0D2U4_ODILC|nr:MAG: phosphate ABC transporter permease PstA [Candidatus Odinarchaeum yellowstonii]
MISKTLKQKIMFTILRLALLFPLGFLFWIIGDIIVKGIWKFTEPGFLITTASADYLSGGILAAIIGSLYLIIFTIIFSLPIGVLGAIYLSEYAKENWLTRIIRRTLTTLAGVPSIVFGIFGYGLFALFLRLGVNIISASLTLALLVIPVITTGSVEALKAVPKDYREAALSLGASKWMAIKDHVIPNAISGIATSSILGISRALGETAPILFMAIMWSNTIGGIFDKFVALPVLVYQLLTQSTNTVLTLPVAYGAALTLLLLAVLINIFAIYLRIKHRRKLAMIRGS